jgi:hypothetical protein
MKKNKIVILVAIILIAGGGVYALKKAKTTRPVPDTTFVPTVPDTVKSDYALLNVPFTSQAPTGNWADPRQEDGCEEASILMAWLWTQNKTITPADAEQAIIDISDYETAHYGNYYDLDAQDTAKLMQDYYHYQKVSTKIDPTIDEIKNELRQGRLVLVPANGQKLGNPHYKQPGPLTHMLVIKGFDDAKSQFITNDSGTQYGKSYVYNYQVLFNAMVNYPSGQHEDQTGRPKAMIMVEK